MITYSATIKVCEKGVQPERAVALFAAMQQQWLSAHGDDDNDADDDEDEW